MIFQQYPVWKQSGWKLFRHFFLVLLKSVASRWRMSFHGHNSSSFSFLIHVTLGTSTNRNALQRKDNLLKCGNMYEHIFCWAQGLVQANFFVSKYKIVQGKYWRSHHRHIFLKASSCQKLAKRKQISHTQKKILPKTWTKLKDLQTHKIFCQ